MKQYQYVVECGMVCLCFNVNDANLYVQETFVCVVTTFHVICAASRMIFKKMAWVQMNLSLCTERWRFIISQIGGVGSLAVRQKGDLAMHRQQYFVYMIFDDQLVKILHHPKVMHNQDYLSAMCSEMHTSAYQPENTWSSTIRIVSVLRDCISDRLHIQA